MQRDQVAEVIGAPGIAALAHHREQAAGGQRRELLQRLADQRQIGVDLRWPRCGADPGQPGLRQHPAHHAVVDLELAGDGADGPLLGVVVAQDLRLDLTRCHHGLRVPCGCRQHGRDAAGGNAGTPGAAAADDVRVRWAEGELPLVRRYVETRYGAASWKCERRVAARIEASANGLDIRYVVTNIRRGSAEWLY